ncbi:HIT domain-containing protein [Paenalcaligenes hominis]|uniref:HIT domain-containing protein n=1 Tax=Paenalcaligenes hominis TaxID=643674 RepID=UPI0035232172
MFELHPTLQADTFFLGQLELCDVLLNNNSSYLWLILVPRRAGIRETYELSPTDQHQLTTECNQVSEKLARYSAANKMNIAAFGNQVPQLHLHLIARHHTDPAWPQPAWLNLATQPYEQQKAQDLLQDLRQLLNV